MTLEIASIVNAKSLTVKRINDEVLTHYQEIRTQVHFLLRPSASAPKYCKTVQKHPLKSFKALASNKLPPPMQLS
jgi:hypothetical protein